MNLFTVRDGDNVASDVRREFARRADGERDNMEVVHLLNGAFLDRRVLFGFLGAVDLQKREAYFWGDGNEEMHFTTYGWPCASARNTDVVPGSETNVVDDQASSGRSPIATGTSRRKRTTNCAPHVGVPCVRYRHDREVDRQTLSVQTLSIWIEFDSENHPCAASH
jgi:hypothetical protein